MESLKEVTLRPWPAQKSEELSQEEIFLQISQLTEERGHLRDITEDSLQRDILQGKDILEERKDKDDVNKKEEGTLTKQQMQEKIFNAQREMYGHLEWAKFAAENALDLISLILSKDPKQVAIPYAYSQNFRDMGLNQGIPEGSFELVVENHENRFNIPDEAKIQELQERQLVAAKGARMEALDCSVDEILKAAKKLEKDVRKETKYWQEIVSVYDKGLPVQRMRRGGRQGFGVRYGLPEASENFKARGFAPLNMGPDGGIIWDPALKLKPKTIRVRISDNGKITGTSQLFLDANLEDLPIEKSVRLARESLFEEELYYEMSVETRQLLAYGVQFRDSVIHIDAPHLGTLTGDQKLLIDCIPQEKLSATEQGHEHDWIAKNVAESLRLLLTHEHSMRLYRRSQLPPPLTGRKKEKTSPPILRTVLAIFRHLEGVDALYTYLERVARTLNSAKLDTTLTTTRATSWANLAATFKDDSKAKNNDQSATDQLLSVFLKPFDGTAALTLPSSSTSTSPNTHSDILQIVTRTIIGAPTYGTEHKLTLPSSLAHDLGLFPTLKFSSVLELTSYLDWLLGMHIARRLLGGEDGKVDLAGEQEARVTIGGGKGKKGAEAKKAFEVRVLIKDGQLEVKGSAVENVGEEEKVCVWKGEEGEGLRDVLKGWVA